jgi:nitrogen fixation NifU-like protein
VNELESLYQDIILDHSRHPHGAVLAENDAASATSFQRNPICGDEVTLRVRVDGDAIRDVTWEGTGCSISQASASMLSALVAEEVAETGLSREAAAVLIADFRAALRSRGEVPLDEEEFGDAAALSGVSRYTARVKCAMLAWVALEDALDHTV